MTHCITTQNIMTLCITTQNIMTLCTCAECHSAECRDLFIVMLNVIVQRVIMLSVVAPLEGLARDKLSSLLEQFESYKESKVL